MHGHLAAVISDVWGTPAEGSILYIAITKNIEIIAASYDTTAS